MGLLVNWFINYIFLKSCMHNTLRNCKFQQVIYMLINFPIFLYLNFGWNIYSACISYTVKVTRFLCKIIYHRVNNGWAKFHTYIHTFKIQSICNTIEKLRKIKICVYKLCKNNLTRNKWRTLHNTRSTCQAKDFLYLFQTF